MVIIVFIRKENVNDEHLSKGSCSENFTLALMHEYCIIYWT